MYDEIPSLTKKNFIERRSDFTRWILTPFIFIISLCLVHGLVIWGSHLLSLFWPKQDIATNLWFYETFVANAVSSYFSVYWGSITAPKYNIIVSYVLGGISILMYLLIFYFILTDDFKWWNNDTVFISLSCLLGAILAIFIIRRDY